MVVEEVVQRGSPLRLVMLAEVLVDVVVEVDTQMVWVLLQI
tara:strand:+ start:102 stop:224 length:123 start_codon:yes stop_codon:yes gene_type:complete